MPVIRPRLLRTLALSSALCLLLTGTALATPIIAFGGPLDPFLATGGLFIAPNATRATNWVQTINVSNATVTADLQAAPALGVSGNVTAFLTTSIGPGTTVANEIAHATVGIPAFAPGVLSTVTLFTGLNLGPAQYYLIIASDGAIWQASDSSQFTRDGIPCLDPPNCAVTITGFPNWQMFAQSAGYIPAQVFTPFHFGFGVMHFSVDGQLDGEVPPPGPGPVPDPTAVPEPGSLVLLLTGLAAGARKLRTRRGDF